MASLTRSQLKTESNSTYDTNGIGGITAAEARTFNNDLIDSLITNDLTSSMIVLSASFAATASYALNSTPLTSLNTFTASQDTKNLTLASYTGSNDTTNTAQNNRLTNLENKSASVDISITNINQFTASNGNTSLNQFTSSANNRLNSLEAATSSYAISSSVAAVDAAQQSQINSLIASTGSYITSSVSIPLTSLNSFTQSQYVSNSFFATTGSNGFKGNQSITGSLVVYGGAFDDNRLSIPIGTLPITFTVDTPMQVYGTFAGSGVGFSFNGSNPRLLFRDSATTYETQIYNSVNDFYVGQNNGKFISFPNTSTPTTIIYNKLGVSGSVSITGSLTASIQQGYAWVGNANGISVAVATSSFADGASTDITSLNAFTASQDTKNTTLASVTASLQGQLTNIGSQSGSWVNVPLDSLNTFTASQDTKNSTLASYTGSNDTKWSNLGSQTGSFVTETESGSFLITASVNLNTITFTKGNNTTFAVTVNTGSAITTDITSLNSFTASQNTKNSTLATYTASVDQKFSNIGSQSGSWTQIPLTSLNTFTQSQDTKNSTIATYTGSNDTKWNNLGAQSGSFVTESETGSFARTNVDNNFTANQTFTNITAVSASFQYIQTTYETASVIYSSGSNQFGDELTDIQTLSGSVKVQGSLTVNGTPVQTSSVDITSLNAFTSSQNTKNSTLATYTASVDSSLSNINSFTSSNGNTSLNSYTASNDTKWSNLAGQTGSYVTSAITASSLITASASGNTITFTKGNASTFSVSVDTGSAATTIFEVVYTGESITKGDPLYISGSQGANPVVYKADASNPAKMPVTFVSNETIGAANTTNAIVLGLIEGIDLTGYTAGQAIYVAEGGGWSTSLPSGSASITQLLGVVTKGGSGGKGLVLNPGPAQLPGLDTGKMWVGNGNNQPTEITTASFASSASFNSYTASNDTKWNTLGGQTGSYVTSVITASSLVTASVNLNTITFTKGDASTFNITVNTGSGGGGSTDITSLNEFTASQNTKNATLGNLTGSFATTGSNTFAGIQTFQDAALNATSLVSTSGSLMLVAKSFTSASAHLSASAGNQVNLIFKNTNTTADTIISGSNNIFTNPNAPTAGFKRYVGGNGSLMLSPTSVNQISASQAFPITTQFNIHTAGAITTRAAVSASQWTIGSNMLIAGLTIGSSAANNAEKILGALTINQNQVGNAVSIIANRTAISASTNIIANAFIGGATTLTMASSSISYTANVGNAIITNGFQNAGGASVNNSLQLSSNWFGGAVISVSGSDAGGLTNPRSLYNNYLFSGFNELGTPIANLSLNGSGSSMVSTMAMGQELGITGSNGLDSNNFSLTPGIGAGSAFFGRWNAQNGNRAKTAETVFAIGTGTSTSLTKTGFLIDSGSNTFIEGTLNVSGSSNFNGNVNVTGSLLVNGSSVPINTGSFATTGSNSFNGNQIITGSLTMSGSIITFDRSGNNTNAIIGLNAMGMGAAGAQPLAINNQSSVAIGNGAMRYASGSQQNVAIGPNALSITSGSNNFALGSEAMVNNTNGSQNVAIGTGALNQNTTGYQNVSIGNDSGFVNVSGSKNVYIGPNAGNNHSGDNTVMLGGYSGGGQILNNNIILSDGSGNVKAQYSGSAWSLQDEIKLNKGTNKPCDIVSVNGSVTVNNSLVTNSSIILVTTQNGLVGVDEYPAVVTSKTVGSFVIAHNYGGSLDVAYLIINPT